MTTPVGTLTARNHRAWGRETSAMMTTPTVKRSPAQPLTGILCIVIPGCMAALAGVIVPPANCPVKRALFKPVGRHPNDPSPVSPRLVKAPAASHPLPSGEGNTSWGRGSARFLVPSRGGEGGPRHAHCSAVAGRMRGYFSAPDSRILPSIAGAVSSRTTQLAFFARAIDKAKTPLTIGTTVPANPICSGAY